MRRSRGSNAPSKRGATSRATFRTTTWAAPTLEKRCTATRCAASRKRWKSSRAIHWRARPSKRFAAWSTEKKVDSRQLKVQSKTNPLKNDGRVRRSQLIVPIGLDLRSRVARELRLKVQGQTKPFHIRRRCANS